MEQGMRMAQVNGLLSVSAPQLMRGITLRVRFARLAGARLWLAICIMRLAGLVAGCPIDIGADGDQDLEFTTDGLPRALSLIEGHKGFRRDAPAFGIDVVVKLDGVQQDLVLSYDIDAGRVSVYPSADAEFIKLSRVGEDADGGLAIVHRKGVVTVERKLS